MITDVEVEVDSGDYWAKRLEVYIRDPWEFAKDCVYTKDEVDKSNPIKKFPADLEYLRLYFKLWVKEERIVVPKSRRMYMSWANLILHLWDAMFHPGRNIAFVSKKEDDANELIKKCLTILENIPESALPKSLRPKFNDKFCELEFPELGSRIMGFPQGADQLRMHTFSRIMADEAAFWDQAEKMYSASIPTLEGGGCMTMISSPAPGFFKRLVFDDLDTSKKEKVAPKKIYPINGVEVWRNPGNKFVVFQLHYSANPMKTDPAYRDGIKSAMPYYQYMQEYELCWDTYEGKPVYPDFNKQIHTVKGDIQPEIGLPLLLGIDQGLNAAVIVCQQQGEQFVAMKEYRAQNMGAIRFKEYVKKQLKVDFPEWNISKDRGQYICGMDPTGFNRRDVDERAYATVWAEDFRVLPGENLWEKRRHSVEKMLTKLSGGKPAFLVSEVGCPVLVRGFEGGYRYPERSFEIEPSKIKPIKDEYADVHDGLQYIATLFEKVQSGTKHEVKGPTYSWMKGSNDGKRKKETLRPR